jgi:DNA methylase
MRHNSRQSTLPLFDFGAGAQFADAGPHEITKLVRAFDDFGQATQETVERGIRYFANEFWTAGQRRAHSIHEISYRACFKPQLPEFFIKRLTREGDAVFDPFMGRGTTPLQAALMGRRPFGNDINPLSVLLTRPRLRPPQIAAIARRLGDVTWSKGEIERDDLLAFYHPETLRRLCALRSWLAKEAPISEPRPDPTVDWIRMVSLNRLTGHSPGFFSGRTMPPNQAVSITA